MYHLRCCMVVRGIFAPLERCAMAIGFNTKRSTRKQTCDKTGPGWGWPKIIPDVEVRPNQGWAWEHMKLQVQSYAWLSLSGGNNLDFIFIVGQLRSWRILRRTKIIYFETLLKSQWCLLDYGDKLLQWAAKIALFFNWLTFTSFPAFLAWWQGCRIGQWPNGNWTRLAAR